MLHLNFRKNSIINLYKYSRRIHSLVFKYIPDAPYCDLLSLKDLDTIQKNIEQRKANGDVNKIKTILHSLESNQINENEKSNLLQQLKHEIWKLPNNTHPAVLHIGENPKEIQSYNERPEFDFKPKAFTELSKKLNILRMEHLGNFTGHKSYYFMGSLAEMEHALLHYALDQLRSYKFNLISVPDILQSDIIEGCGMETSGERTQVYKLSPSGRCLSGTSEMALAGYFSNKVINIDQLPIKVAAISRCFRAETSGLQEEKGIYRVHQFTKAEMFSICTKEQSNEMLEQFKDIEIDLYKKLGLHFKLLDMPPNELGSPAYRKYDIEAWMPGRNMWGEISSCSNCTDYQSKRLSIKYKGNDGNINYAHTVNGTACAIPRLLIALLESNQRKDDVINIPEILWNYMNNRKEIRREKLPELKLVKSISP